MRKLSTLVREGIVENAAEETANPDVEALRALVMSEEFAEGLFATISTSRKRIAHRLPVGSAEPQPLEPDLAQIKEWIGTVRFCGVSTVETVLYWNSTSGQEGNNDQRGQNAIVPNSHKCCSAFYDASAKAIFVGHKDSNWDFLDQLVDAFMLALPSQCRTVGSRLLRCMFTCTQPGFIIHALAEMGVEYTPMCDDTLGPGDECPPQLLDNLIWSMDESFCEDEYTMIQRDGVFITVMVLPWDENVADGNALSRSYRIRTSREDIEIRQHFELYKICWNGPGRQQTGKLVPIGDVHDSNDEPAGDGHASKLRRVKEQLHEMSRMTESEYKAAMRRLYLAWHPDKAGDSPLANRIFCLLR